MDNKEKCSCCCGTEPKSKKGKFSVLDNAEIVDNEEELCRELFSQTIPEKSDSIKKIRKTCC